MNDFKVKVDRTKVIGILVMVVAMVIVMLISLIITYDVGYEFFILFAVLGFSFFTYEGSYLFKTFIGKNAVDYVIEADENGIIDRSLSSSPGFISWSEIAGIQVKSLFGMRSIVIELKDRKSFSKKLNSYQRFTIGMNRRFRMPDVVIAMNRSSITADELLIELKRIEENATL